ncbi:hypothetical protein L6452_37350 [Arctium lappa]|uniref:Uncharacterized protein n=1 Tax=Arctium lappa TaxID=4217 RepID=A0ACB8Y228_ARCLA|nr:hypothetical protein L6452_37350 [Arctium lappa]
MIFQINEVPDPLKDSSIIIFGSRPSPRPLTSFFEERDLSPALLKEVGPLAIGGAKFTSSSKKTPPPPKKTPTPTPKKVPSPKPSTPKCFPTTSPKTPTPRHTPRASPIPS